MKSNKTMKKALCIVVSAILGLLILWVCLIRSTPQTREEKRVKDLMRNAQSAAHDKRLSAIQALGQMRCEPAVDELIRLLPDSRPDIRMALITTLSQIGSPKAATPMEALMNANEWQVRKATVEALGEIHSAVSIPALGAALHDQHPSVAMAAAIALSGMGDPALPVLTAAVEGPAALQRKTELIAAQKALTDAKQASSVEKQSKQEANALAGLSRQCEELENRHNQVNQVVAYALGRMSDPGALPVLRRMLSDPSPLTRLAGAEALCLKSSAESAEALAPLLNDPSPEVRQGIVRSLPKLGDAAVPLFVKLSSERERSMRFNVIKFLSETKDPRRLPVLFMAQGDPDKKIRDIAEAALNRIPKTQLVALASENLRQPASPMRNKALELLAEAKDPSSADSLAAVLNDENHLVRMKAAEILGMLKDSRGAESIARSLADPDPEIRYSAAQFLARSGDARGADVLLAIVRRSFSETKGAVDDPKIKKVYRNDTKRVAEALQLLGQLGDKRVADFAVLGVQNDLLGLFGASAEALGRLRDPRAFDLLSPLVLRPGLLGRDHVVNALGYLGDPRAVDLLVELVGRLEGVIVYRVHSSIKVVGDSNPAKSSQDHFNDSLRVPIAGALAHLGGDQAVKTIIAIVESTPSHKVAWLESLCKTMGEMGDPQFIKPLAKLLSHDCPEPPIAAMQALKKMGPKTIAILIAELKEPDLAQHTAISSALADFGGPAVDPLLVALKNPEPMIRHGAAWALGQMGEQHAVEPLLGMLSDENSETRASVIWALGQLKVVRAVDPLIQLAGDTQVVARAAVAEALGLLGDGRAMHSLETLTQDKDAGVARAARESLKKLTAQTKTAGSSLTNATDLSNVKQ